jgi:hypothetical protein
MEKDTEASMALIDATCDRLDSAVKTCRRRLKEKVTSVRDDIKGALTAGKAERLGRKVKLTSHKRVVERAQSLRSSYATDLAASLEMRVKALHSTTTPPTEVTDMKALTLTIDPKAIAGIEEALEKLGSSGDLAMAPPEFKFHYNHAPAIVLSNNQLTATKKTDGGFDNASVAACDPMQVDALYEVSMCKYLFFSEDGVHNTEIKIMKEYWWKCFFFLFYFLFGQQVRVDQVTNSFKHSLFVGVLTSSPGAVELGTLPDLLNKPFSIMLGSVTLYVNDNKVGNHFMCLLLLTKVA